MLTFSVNKGQQRVILHLFIMCFVCLRGWKLGRSGSGSKNKINTIRCFNIYICIAFMFICFSSHAHSIKMYDVCKPFELLK